MKTAVRSILAKRGLPGLTSLRLLPLCCAVLLGLLAVASGTANAQQVPEGFRSELVYEVPEIEHPSVVTCDDAGNLFVGEDPMDMRGPTTEEFDRVLYIVFDESGQPVRKTVFADQLSAVFGLIWHEGSLYVMHAPHYTRFEDTDGDGVADVREELATGFGPPAGIFGFNDHIVTGTRLGLDGLVYVSVGDKGIPRATGSDGSEITLEGGGVVRMRLDGSQLEVVTSGTRNHLDVAMDRLDNIFTYDNTDDGLGWWTRFTHHVPGGYYGYPYDYHPHPERHLPRISEHGGGSPCGAACYRDTVWPAEYQGNAFFCEWGKQKIQRFILEPDGASFTARMEDFMTGDGTSDFRPLDLCFSPDGRVMYVADWNFGGWQKPDRRGRVFRVEYVGENAGASNADTEAADVARVDDTAAVAEQALALGHPDHSERVRAGKWFVRQGEASLEPLAELLADEQTLPAAKVHAIWAQNGLLDTLPDYDPSPQWIRLLDDPDAEVRGQAARALGLRRMTSAVEPLVGAVSDADPGVRLRVAHALGRIGDQTASPALWQALNEPDRYVQFTVIQALRQLASFDHALEVIQQGDAATREAALVVLTTQYDTAAVQTLNEIIQQATDPQVRAAAVRAMAEVHRKADPYESGWWGTQPARNPPARPKQHAWDGTEQVLTALRESLTADEPLVRLAAVESLPASDLEPLFAALRNRVSEDPDSAVRIAAMQRLAAVKDSASVPLLATVAADEAADETLRRAAVSAITATGSPEAIEQLVQLVRAESSSAELVVLAITALGNLRAETGLEAIHARAATGELNVRQHALTALRQIQGGAATGLLLEVLNNEPLELRRHSLNLLGELAAAEAIPAILLAANDPELEFEALTALAKTPDPRALNQYLRGVQHPNQSLRDACRAALGQVREQVGPEIIALHQRGELTSAARRELLAVYSTPVPLGIWQFFGPWPKGHESAPEFDTTAAADLERREQLGESKLRWRKLVTSHPEGRLSLHEYLRPNTGCWGMGYAEIEADQAGLARLHLGSDDQAVLWVNGQELHRFDSNRAWSADGTVVECELVAGTNTVWFLCGNDGGPWEMSLSVERADPRFAFLSEATPTELNIDAYRQHALERAGNPARGEQLFLDTKGVGCVKCHALAGQGALVGPDLRGVGAKYPREELIRSILEPSSRILSGYEMSVIITDDGRALQGVIKLENEQGVTLLDAEGREIQLAAEEIDEIERSNVSMMPNGLKDGMTLEDFADIVAFLEQLREVNEAATGN